MIAHKTEKGQTLVLILFAVVALMGFAALAVDGGRVYSERRRAQNAADSAAFAAAMAESRELDWIDAALDQAGVNGFVDGDESDNPGNPVDVEVYNPPVDGPYAGNDQYFQIFIDQKVDQIFSQFVFNGPFKVSVEAVARARPVSSIFPGNALHATSPDSCKAVWFHGSEDTNINGGNVFSNSNADGHPCDSGSQDGGGDVHVTGGGIITVGTFEVGSGTVTAEDGFEDDVDTQALPDFGEPDCSGQPNRSYGGGDAVLEPGRYANGIKVNGSNNITLKKGMYCLEDDVTMLGGTITGNGVMFVMQDGAFNLGGNTSVRLYRSNHILDSSGEEWGGMLVFMPLDNDNEVFISGGSGSMYTGTIFAPGPRSPESQPKCVIEGNGTSLGLSSNIICYSVKFGGSAQITINFDPQRNYQMPPQIELAE